MTTDFSYGGKQILANGPIKPSGKDMPLDARTRINTYSERETIPNPFVGMIVTVLTDENNNNEMQDYKVKSLKANSAGIANMVIDEMIPYVDYLGVSAGGGSGEGLTSTQKQQLQTAYNHSQTPHVTSDDLLNIDAVSLNGKKFSEPMTKDDYESIDPDPNTIYIINDNNSIISLPEYSSIEANKVLAVNNDGTALTWVNAPSESGSGLTTEQANQLTVAYNHSQTVHVQISDIPTKLSQLENDLVLVSDSGKKFKLKVSDDGVLSTEPCEVYADIIISSDTIVVNESSTNTFTVTLNEAPVDNQVVSLSVNNNNCALDKTSLTFTSDNYNTPQTVTVTGTHDSSSYENKNSVITLSGNNATSKTINVTINNIDTPPSLQSISAVYTQGETTVYPTTSLDSLKSNLVVTATYSDDSTNIVENYALSGELTVGTSTITVTYQEKTTTFDVTVTESTEPVLQSISAVYTQEDNVIYPASPLNALTFNLVVTATYSDNSTAEINSGDYALSGTLTVGTSTITATYQDKTATFDVNVIEKPSISEFTNEHFVVGRTNQEAVDGYFTVNRADDNRIRINFKSKEIAMGMTPLTDYDVTLNIVENTMDAEIVNNTPAMLFTTSGTSLEPAVTANYTGETTFTIKSAQDNNFTDRVNRFYNLAIILNDESATSGYIKFSISMKPHADNV